MAEVLGQRERSGVPTGGDALESDYRDIDGMGISLGKGGASALFLRQEGI